jgi:peroxiredoxin
MFTKEMKIYRPLISLVLLTYCAILAGQEVIIKGSGKGYFNAGLRFYVQSDPVTKRLKPLATVRCDENGKFSFGAACSGKATIFIRSGIFKFHLYVTEGAVYELSLPDNILRPAGEEQEPFFIETELIPEVINNPKDVNNLIGVFDAEYNPVFNFVAESVFRNYRKDEIQKQISKLEKYSEPVAVPFYDDYVKCRMIMLNLVASSSKQTQALATQFINSGFSFENQAFTDLADQMFSGYFKTFSTAPSKNSFDRAIAIASFQELESVILKEIKINNKELADYIILLNLNSDYNERNLPGENVRKILSLMRSQSESGFVKNAASAILDRINSSLPGNYPPAFTLVDNNGKMKSLNDFRGKYMLLGFARADNMTSVTELSVVNMWQKKYLKELNVVTIITDNNFKTAAESLNKYGFSWTLLNGSDREDLEFSYDLKMYPYFLLLDRDGKVIANPCQFPSEGLELTINRIITADLSGSGPENR